MIGNMDYNEKIKQSIKSLFQRTKIAGTKEDGEIILEAINEAFPTLRPEHIDAAIRKGSIGEYGKIYNRLTAQEICIWIRAYMENAPFLDVDDMWYREKGCSIEDYAKKTNRERLESTMERHNLVEEIALDYMKENGYICNPTSIREAQKERFNNIKNR
jgi:hypothetical protein